MAMASDVQKLVVFVAASVLFLGVLYLFTSDFALTGAGVVDTAAASFPASSPLIIFIVLGIVTYTLLTIMRKRE